VVGGVVVVRYGQNVLSVIERVKQKLEEIKPSLPEGVEIVTTYDRSDLIHRAIATLQRTLIEESIIVSLVVILFLLDIGGALRAVITLPLAVTLAFIPLYFMGLSANIMSLGGIAIAIGALVDEAVVMVENVHKKLEYAPPGPRPPRPPGDHHQGVPAARQAALLLAPHHHGQLPAGVHAGGAGGPPVQAAGLHQDLLDGVGRVPVHHHRPRADRAADPRPRDPGTPPPGQPASCSASTTRGSAALMRRRRLSIAIAVVAVLSAWPVYHRLGSEFMPPLNEGAILYMPTTLPTLSITEATRLLQIQDRILKSFPEVLTVHGKAGRAETATDPAPLEMFETVIQLKPEREWRRGMTYRS
jgi:Cu(I)/Ag(I) efflux system membrane protein CusA/SilA